MARTDLSPIGSTNKARPATVKQRYSCESDIDLADIALLASSFAGGILAVALVSSLFIFATEIGARKRPPIYDETQLCLSRDLQPKH
jgi:hypothetical protein